MSTNDGNSMMNKFTGATKPLPVVLLCMATLLAGFALGLGAARPGIAQAERASLDLMEAESARLVSKTLAHRDNLAIVIQAVKDRPDAAVALRALLSTDTQQKFGKTIAAAGYEANIGFARARQPYLNFVDFPSGNARVEEQRVELETETSHTKKVAYEKPRS